MRPTSPDRAWDGKGDVFASKNCNAAQNYTANRSARLFVVFSLQPSCQRQHVLAEDIRSLAPISRTCLVGLLRLLPAGTNFHRQQMTALRPARRKPEPPPFELVRVDREGSGGPRIDVKRPRPEQIFLKLRHVEGLMGQGMPRIDAIRQIGLTEQISRSGPPPSHTMPIATGERIRRELQRADARRAFKRRNLLLATRSPNHHRKLEETVQHQMTP